LSRLQPLVIDEIGYLTLKPEQANAFFRLMDERYNRVSTIITTSGLGCVISQVSAPHVIQQPNLFGSRPYVPSNHSSSKTCMNGLSRHQDI
jgi:hypothetical protein